MKNLLVYGSYGYTGRLIVDEAISKGMKPIVAGRNEEKVKSQAEKHGLEWMAFGMDEADKLREFLNRGDVVIHCGGPFIHTARTMVEACLETNTHYLDITGEYEVFDLCQEYSQQAEEKNLMILPGAGFDVVPSDCLAQMLKSELPEATHLELAFVNKGGKLSRGTAKTMIESLGSKQAYRKDGEYAFAKMGEQTRLVDFGNSEETCMAISWGDISTAHFSTGIPNIKVFAGTHPKQIAQVRKMNSLGWLLRMRFVKNFMQKKLDSKPDGQSEQKRAKSVSLMWGKAWHDDSSVEKRIKVPNGYSLTANSSMSIARKVLNGDFKSGYQTPSTAYGKDLIMEMDGVEYI